MGSDSYLKHLHGPPRLADGEQRQPQCVGGQPHTGALVRLFQEADRLFERCHGLVGGARSEEDLAQLSGRGAGVRRRAELEEPATGCREGFDGRRVAAGVDGDEPPIVGRGPALEMVTGRLETALGCFESCGRVLWPSRQSQDDAQEMVRLCPLKRQIGKEAGGGLGRGLRFVQPTGVGKNSREMKAGGGVLHRIALRPVAVQALGQLRHDRFDVAHRVRILRRVRVVIAGFGNVLRGDDGFGVAVAHALLNLPLPPEVTVMEIGIGGIHLVQELLSPADVLIIVDASDLNRAPGTVVVMEPEITDVVALALPERRDELADMHYATPDRALILAGGLGIVPATTWFVGCQPLHSDDPEIGLSGPVRAAVAPAVEEVRRLVRDAGVRW